MSGARKRRGEGTSPTSSGRKNAGSTSSNQAPDDSPTLGAIHQAMQLVLKEVQDVKNELKEKNSKVAELEEANSKLQIQLNKANVKDLQDELKAVKDEQKAQDERIEDLKKEIESLHENPPCPCTIPVNIVMEDKRNFLIRILPSATVLQLKKRVELKEHVEPRHQRLILKTSLCGGTQLVDDRTLTECGMKSGSPSTVCLLLPRS